MITRRNLIGSLFAAPAVLKLGLLMPIKPVLDTEITVCGDGWLRGPYSYRFTYGDVQWEKMRVIYDPDLMEALAVASEKMLQSFTKRIYYDGVSGIYDGVNCIHSLNCNEDNT